MPQDRTPPGDALTQRLMERRSLKQIQVPGVGVAYRGPTATRALKALGARAMTVDRSVIVGEDFDPSKPADAALFAHEQYHAQRGDGGGAAHPIHEAEEVAARATERMVFHQMSADPGHHAPAEVIHRAVDGQRSQPEAPSSNTETGGAEGVYRALRQQGLSHEEIVALVADDLKAREQTSGGLEEQRGRSTSQMF